MAGATRALCLALLAGMCGAFSPGMLGAAPRLRPRLANGRSLGPRMQASQGQRESIQRSVWRMEAPGNLKDLKLVKDVLPPPEAGEVRVQVQAVGLNFADVFTALGMYDAAPKGEPVVPGLEFAGIVEEVGSRITPKPGRNKSVQRSKDGLKYVVLEGGDAPRSDTGGGGKEMPLRPGDRVMGFIRFGAFATHVNVPTTYVRVIPEEWSFEEGAAFVVQALTAWYGAVELGRAQRAKSVLIHSAAGGVGLHTLQICQMLGVVPVALVGSASKAEFLRDKFGLSSDQVVVRPWRAQRFEQELRRVRAALGLERGFDVVMDSVAGRYFEGGYKSLAAGGRHILFGAATYTPFGDRGLTWKSFGFWFNIVPTFLTRPKLDVQKMIGENKSVSGFNLIWLTDGRSDPEALGKMMDEILKPSVRWLPPYVGKVFPFDDAINALRYFKSGKSVGKVILSVSEDDAAKGK